MNKACANDQGISLVEVILAVALLVVVVAALVRLGVSTLSTSDAARVRSVAQELGNEILDIARIKRDNDPDAFFALASSPGQYYEWDETLDSFIPTTCDPGDFDGDAAALDTIGSSCDLEVLIGDSAINFYRIVGIRGTSTSKEIIVHVLWDNRGEFSNVVTGTTLTRWRN